MRQIVKGFGDMGGAVDVADLQWAADVFAMDDDFDDPGNGG